MVYNITSRESFLKVKQFLDDLTNNCRPDIIIYLIGNKLDLVQTSSDLRKVSYKEARHFANENGLFFMETSALTSERVSDAFENVLAGKSQLLKLRNLREEREGQSPQDDFNSW